jgi:hypothetical protein
MKLKLKPAVATPAPEPSALGESTPTEPALEADAALLDLPLPKLPQGEARAGGEEQVEAPDVAPVDSISKHLTAHG